MAGWHGYVVGLGLLALGACAGAGPHSDFDRLGLPDLTPDRILASDAANAGREIARIERGLEDQRYLAGRVEPRQACAAHLRLAWLRLQVRDLGGAHRELHAAERLGIDVPDAVALTGLIRARILAAEGSWSEAHRRLAEAVAVRTSDEMRRHLDEAEADFQPPGKTQVLPHLPAITGGTLEITPRQAWGSQQGRADRMTAMGKPSRITIHHTAMYGPSEASAARKQIRAIQHDHQNGQGWGDIGYHFLIDRAGRVYEGRSLGYQGAHAGDGASNAHNIGICLLGNYHDQRVGAVQPQRLTEEQLRGMLMLVAHLRQRHAIPVDRIYTHREIHPGGPGATECPGATLQGVVEAMRRVYARG